MAAFPYDVTLGTPGYLCINAKGATCKGEKGQWEWKKSWFHLHNLVFCLYQAHLRGINQKQNLNHLSDSAKCYCWMFMIGKKKKVCKPSDSSAYLFLGICFFSQGGIRGSSDLVLIFTWMKALVTSFHWENTPLSSLNIIKKYTSNSRHIIFISHNLAWVSAGGETVKTSGVPRQHKVCYCKQLEPISTHNLIHL